MDHIPDEDKIVFIALTIIVPIIGYMILFLVNRAANKAIELKILDKGIYKNNPLTGDAVIPIAKRCRRIGVILFAFAIAVTILSISLLYINW
jgi:hypothetical protein